MSLKERRHFRIKYPETAYPSLIVNNFSFLIQDVSESGLKFICGAEVPALNSLFSAEIEFFSGVKHRCRCKVVRVVGKAVMVTFDQDIPKKTLEAEAQKLIDTFGKLETTKF